MLPQERESGVFLVQNTVFEYKKFTTASSQLWIVRHHKCCCLMVFLELEHQIEHPLATDRIEIPSRFVCQQ